MILHLVLVPSSREHATVAVAMHCLIPMLDGLHALEPIASSVEILFHVAGLAVDLGVGPGHGPGHGQLRVAEAAGEALAVKEPLPGRQKRRGGNCRFRKQSVGGRRFRWKMYPLPFKEPAFFR